MDTYTCHTRAVGNVLCVLGDPELCQLYPASFWSWIYCTFLTTIIFKGLNSFGFFRDISQSYQSMGYMNVKLILISKEITAFAAQGDAPMRLFSD